MLSELKTSHTEYLIPDDMDYFVLADIFKTGALKGEVPKFFPNGEIKFTGIGILTTKINGQTFIRSVITGTPAEAAGLKSGDRIISVDGAPYRSLRAFSGKTGKSVSVAVQSGRSREEVKTVSVVPQEMQPGKLLMDAMEKSVKVFDRGGRKIGYIHVWSYAGDQYQDLLEREIAGGKLKDADALVFDLRDGWGGAVPEYLNVFNKKVPLLTLTNRKGETGSLDSQWRKPVVMLVNGWSRSGKEILAFGFKKYGIGKVIGTRTEGYVMGGRAFMLSSGNILYLAVDDVRVDGERLEGKGVEPDINVPAPLEYSHGQDPQLDAALGYLSK